MCQTCHLEFKAQLRSGSLALDYVDAPDLLDLLNECHLTWTFVDLISTVCRTHVSGMLVVRSLGLQVCHCKQVHFGVQLVHEFPKLQYMLNNLQSFPKKVIVTHSGFLAQPIFVIELLYTTGIISCSNYCNSSVQCCFYLKL